MVNTIDEARTPAELAEWLRVWADGYEEGVDYLDDNDARQLAEAVERVCAPGNAAAMREALERCNELFRCDDDNKSRLCHLARKADEVTRAALSAPARNCDRYDVEDGVAACMQAIDAAWHEIDTIRVTIGWMFAPAEGGDHA